jgi:hypothetical protein
MSSSVFLSALPTSSPGSYSNASAAASPFCLSFVQYLSLDLSDIVKMCFSVGKRLNRRSYVTEAVYEEPIRLHVQPDHHGSHLYSSGRYCHESRSQLPRYASRADIVSIALSLFSLWLPGPHRLVRSSTRSSNHAFLPPHPFVISTQLPPSPIIFLFRTSPSTLNSLPSFGDSIQSNFTTTI